MRPRPRPPAHECRSLSRSQSTERISCKACNTQQGILWRSSWRRRATSVAHTTSLWLSRASITSSAAAGSLAASLDRMLSHRASASATWNLGCSGHCRGSMQAWLFRTLAWLSGDSTTSPTAAGVLVARSGTTRSSQLTRSVTQATLRLSELQHARSPCGGHR